jgi:hypothetical protein
VKPLVLKNSTHEKGSRSYTRIGVIDNAHETTIDRDQFVRSNTYIQNDNFGFGRLIIS